MIMEQNTQGTQKPETQQKNSPENSGQKDQNSANKQGFTPSSPSYAAQQGEDERNDNRQEDADQRNITSQQRNPSNSGSDQDRSQSRDNEGNKGGSNQRGAGRSEDKGNSQGQNKSGNNSGD